MTVAPVGVRPCSIRALERRTPSVFVSALRTVPSASSPDKRNERGRWRQLEARGRQRGPLEPDPVQLYGTAACGHLLTVQQRPQGGEVLGSKVRGDAARAPTWPIQD